MNCDSVRNWLLQVESLQPKHWPPDVTKHVKSCAGCVKFVNSLNKLEKAWRDQPVGTGCNEAKAAFVKALAERAPPAKAKPAWRPVRWAAVAAMLLIAVGAFAWMLFSPGQSRAGSSDIVERLIDWNLELTNADAKDRQRLLEHNEMDLRRDLENARSSLSPEDYELGENLLENGQWLATHDDPDKEVERITEIADKLLVHADTAKKTGNEKEYERYGMRYSAFMERGVNPLFQKMAQLKAPDTKKGLENHKKQLEKMLERSPERSRPELHKKVEGFFKKVERPKHRFKR